MYKFKAVYNRTKAYLNSESEEKQITKKLSTPVIETVTPLSKYSTGDIIPITISITNTRGNPIKNYSFTLNINNTTYNRKTDSEGLYTFTHTINSENDLQLTVTTEETETYESTTLTKTLETDNRINTQISLTSSATDTSFINTITLTATATDELNSTINGQVEFYEENTLISTVTAIDGIAILNHRTDTIGNHKYTAVLKENDEYLSSTSPELNVSVTKDKPDITMITGDIYQGWVTACVLKDSNGNVLGDKIVNISVSTNNSDFTDYLRNTDENGKARLTMNWNPNRVYIKYIFDGDSYYESVTLSKSFMILSPKSVSKAVGNIVSSPASDKAPYRKWYDTYTNGTDNYLKAGNSCSSSPIGSSSGSYNRPASIVKSSWGFNIPSGASVKKIKCVWRSKNGTCSSSTACISVPAGVVKLTGTGSSTLTGTGKKGGSNKFITSTIEWEDSKITSKGINSSSMKLTLSHGANTNANIGIFYVIGPTLTVYYIPPQGSV